MPDQSRRARRANIGGSVPARRAGLGACMLFDLSRLRGDTDHLDRRYPPEAFDLAGEEFRLTAPVQLAADVRRDGKKVRLRGRVTTTLELPCSRCLEPFAVPVDAELDSLFLPATENTGEGEREVEEDELGVSFYRDDVIDLGEAMREQFFLAVPMKPVCREDCQGLCPVCGVNRNREACAGHPEWVDPRLEPLRRLTKR
jgi:uncharacterized protein